VKDTVPQFVIMLKDPDNSVRGAAIDVFHQMAQSSKFLNARGCATFDHISTDLLRTYVKDSLSLLADIFRNGTSNHQWKTAMVFNSLASDGKYSIFSCINIFILIRS
jgi:hypothetical protein